MSYFDEQRHWDGIRCYRWNCRHFNWNLPQSVSNNPERGRCSIISSYLSYKSNVKIFKCTEITDVQTFPQTSIQILSFHVLQQDLIIELRRRLMRHHDRGNRTTFGLHYCCRSCMKETNHFDAPKKHKFFHKLMPKIAQFFSFKTTC